MCDGARLARPLAGLHLHSILTGRYTVQCYIAGSTLLRRFNHVFFPKGREIVLVNF